MATITREEIIKALQKRGFTAEATDIEKNNVICHGIQFKQDRIAPVIYTDSIIAEAEKNGTPLESIVNGIIAIYETHSTPAIDIDKIMTKPYIMEHVRIGLQRKTGEEIIKRTCPLDEAIEEYLYITLEMGDGAGSIKIKAGMLEAAGIEEPEAWTQAENNTFNDTTVEDMSIVMQAFGMPTAGDSGMYVISNKDKCKGAAAVLNKKALQEIGERHHTKKLVVIPSSIHECLVLPEVEMMDINAITNMVISVNASTVDPVEQLADRAYIITL